MPKVVSVTFFIVLIGVGILLRSISLDSLRPIEMDERTWFQVGLSLLRGGIPATWTIFSGAYSGRDQVRCGDASQEVVTPYLDHPPLFSLFIGLWASMVGQEKDDFCPTSWALARIPMVLIALASFVVTFLFVQKIFGNTLATFSLIAFVFYPSHIIATRFITPEHLIALFLILGLYLFAVFETARWRSLYLLSVFLMTVLCVVSPLTKLTGVVVPATLLGLALIRRHYSLCLVLLMASLLSVLLLFGYGWYFGWDTFQDILAAHTGRSQNFIHFWTLFTSLDLGNFAFWDPSIIAGLVGVLGLSFFAQREARAYIFVPLLVISLLFLYVAPWESYGWYKYTLHPLIAVGLGFIFTRLHYGKAEYLVLFLPLLSMMLQNSALLDQSDRRVMVLMFYMIALLPVVTRNRFLRFREVFISLLILLFFFEALWVLNVLQFSLSALFFNLFS